MCSISSVIAQKKGAAFYSCLQYFIWRALHSFSGNMQHNDVWLSHTKAGQDVESVCLHQLPARVCTWAEKACMRVIAWRIHFRDLINHWSIRQEPDTPTEAAQAAEWGGEVVLTHACSMWSGTQQPGFCAIWTLVSFESGDVNQWKCNVCKVTLWMNVSPCL